MVAKKETAGQMTPVEVPADFKRKGLVEVLRGKDYINHKGIVKLLHMHGVMSIKAEPVLELCSVDDMYFTFKCEIVGTRCCVTMCADASPANVSRNIASACSRMAETRAVNRAGRTYLGLGQTTFDEMPVGVFDNAQEEKGSISSDSLRWSDKFGGSQSQFFKELDKMKMDYDTVKAITVERWGTKPSEMDAGTLEQIVEWLKSKKGLAYYKSMQEKLINSVEGK